MELKSNGVLLLNQLDEGKVSRLIPRMLDSLAKHSRSLFTEEEELKLAQMLGMDVNQVKLLLDTLKEILVQGTYNLWKPTVLNEKMIENGVDETVAQVVTSSYTQNAKSTVETLRKRLLAPNQLMDVKWELNLETSSSKHDQMVSPSAVLQLNSEQQPITMEFNKQQLTSLYDKIEEIQSHIDALR